MKFTWVFLALFVGTSFYPVQADERVKVPIPTKSQVGATCLPEAIAPVKAPFPMPEFKKPKFPALTVKITEHGAKQHAATYASGRKTGGETFWSPAGRKIWMWQRNLKTNRATWANYWPNGKKRAESEWNINPQARDLKRNFFGYVADGLARQWDEQGKLVAKHQFVNGDLAESDPLSKAPAQLGGTE